MNSEWQTYHKDFLFLQGKICDSNEFFAFDLDGALITYKNGQDPSRSNINDSNNWIFLGLVKNIILKLSSIYSIFIITNQSRLTEVKKQLIENVWNTLDRIPFVLCAHKNNIYRNHLVGF